MKEDVGDNSNAKPFFWHGQVGFFSLSARQEADEVFKKPLTSNFSMYQIQKILMFTTCTISIEAPESY
jgi:hypothetical protein